MNAQTLIDIAGNLLKVLGVCVATAGVIRKVRDWRHQWKTRHFRSIWGFRGNDHVLVVCSELDKPEKRQMVEPREFIYCLKYGDVDAYFETVLSLLKLYPNIKLECKSSGEVMAQNADFLSSSHIVIIGGPDYNELAYQLIVEDEETRFIYRSVDLDNPSQKAPNEIVIHDSHTDEEYYSTVEHRDYGYIERIRSPYNANRWTILIGGCHTLGVTGAIKAISTAAANRPSDQPLIRRNARLISKSIAGAKHFVVKVSANRVGQTINVPTVHKSDVLLDDDSAGFLGRALGTEQMHQSISVMI